MFAVIEQEDGSGNLIFQIQTMNLLPESGNIPRLDSRITAVAEDTTYYSSTNTTIFRIPYSFSNSIDQFIPIGTGSYAGSIIDVVVTEGGEDHTILEASGNYALLDGINGYVGQKYTSTITLSDIFVRDQQNNIIPGTLNLRYGIMRHRNTGPYTVGVTRKGRGEKAHTFFQEVVGSRETTLEDEFFEKDGVFKFPLMGYSDDLVIKVTSDFPNPMNITNIELTGKFKRVPHFLTT
jgi:hypothetical protein